MIFNPTVVKIKPKKRVSEVRLVGSSYYTLGYTPENPENMYTDTDSDTYVMYSTGYITVESYRYFGITGFNFDIIPDSAVISSITALTKWAANANCAETQLIATTRAGTTGTVVGNLLWLYPSTDPTVFSADVSTSYWNQIKSAGSYFFIGGNNVNASASGKVGIYRIYGAELRITFASPVVLNN